MSPLVLNTIQCHYPKKGYFILFWAQKEEKNKRRKKRMKQRKTENRKPT